MNGFCLPCVLLVACVAACGTSSSSALSDASNDGVGESDAPTGCGAGESTTADGRCESAGIPADRCAPGFVSDGKRGCDPILPPAPCDRGKIALLGETICHDVAPCGSGTWGSIPVDASTQYVDASFSGTSDGSAKAPWTTVQKAIGAASPNAVVAVAAGTYAEDVIVSAKPVRLYGRCPSLVEITGKGFAVRIASLASKSEVHDVALRGGGGVLISLSDAVVLDRLWIHDTGGRGVEVQAKGTGVTISGSLIERTKELGVFVGGAQATIEQTVVRDVAAGADSKSGIGVEIEDIDATQPSDVTIRSSIVASTLSAGVRAFASNATLDGVLVRDVAPRALDGAYGFGVEILDDLGRKSIAAIRASVVERSTASGIFVEGSDATIESTAVRDTRSSPDGKYGEGVVVEFDRSAEIGASLDMRASVVSSSLDFGVLLVGADATIDGVLVRDTKARTIDSLYGDGIAVFSDGAPASADVTASRIEASARAGVSSFGGRFALGTTAIDCDAIALDGEPFGPASFSFEDRGGDACGCGGADVVCQVSSSGLAPPEPAPGP